MFTSIRAVVSCLLVAAATVGCSDSNKSPASPSSPTPSPLNITFQISPGQDFIMEDNSFSIRFQKVTEDSRCGAAALCITSGQAVLALTARIGTGASTDFALATLPGRDSNTIAGYNFKLEGVAPYPIQSPSEINPADYRATLHVVRP